MNTATITEKSNIANFKIGVDSLLQKREYFAQQILPTLVENKDFYTIKGRKSLGKAGAEKIASIYNLVATFFKDKETIESFQSIPGLVAYICKLTRNGAVVGEGRGAAVLKENGNDANKTIKMAQKSAFIDSTIRTTGLSDIFTQDIEDMSPVEIAPVIMDRNEEVSTRTSQIDDSNAEYLESISCKQNDIAQSAYEPITEKQKKFLTNLIWEYVNGEEEREKWLSGIDSHSKDDASELISSLLMSAGR